MDIDMGERQQLNTYIKQLVVEVFPNVRPLRDKGWEAVVIFQLPFDLGMVMGVSKAGIDSCQSWRVELLAGDGHDQLFVVENKGDLRAALIEFKDQVIRLFAQNFESE